MHSNIYRFAKIMCIIHLLLLTATLLSTFLKDEPIVIMLGIFDCSESIFPDQQNETHILSSRPVCWHWCASLLSPGSFPSPTESWVISSSLMEVKTFQNLKVPKFNLQQLSPELQICIPSLLAYISTLMIKHLNVFKINLFLLSLKPGSNSFFSSFDSNTVVQLLSSNIILTLLFISCPHLNAQKIIMILLKHTKNPTTSHHCLCWSPDLNYHTCLNSFNTPQLVYRLLPCLAYVCFQLCPQSDSVKT